MMSRDEFFKMLDRCCDGTLMSYNGCDYMKVTGMVIENITTGTRYFKGLDF